MRIELAFEDVSDDIEGAVADVLLEDASEADAPSRVLSSARSEPFDIRRSRPRVSLDMSLERPPDVDSPTLFVKVSVPHGVGGAPTFINTSTVTLPTDPLAPVNVTLERTS